MLPDDEYDKLQEHVLQLTMRSFGSGGKIAPETEKEMNRGLVRLALITAQRHFQPVAFLALPAHLPEGDREMKSLYISAALKDQQLRQDLLEWSRENASIAIVAARTLQTFIEAIRMGQKLYATANDQQANDDANELWDFVRTFYQIDPGKVPPDLSGYCLAVIMGTSPVPEWMRGRAPKVFVKTQHTTTRGGAKLGEVFKGNVTNETREDD